MKNSKLTGRNQLAATLGKPPFSVKQDPQYPKASLASSPKNF
jgi:hypothetical protein